MAKRLTDLFKVGTAVVVEDGEDKVEVWLQKLVPAESAQAIERASAKRAKFLTLKSLPPDSDELVLQKEELLRTYSGPDDLKSLAGSEELMQAKASVEAELAADEEWSKDGYLLGLQSVWESEVAAKIEANTEDPEALRVQAELTRFAEQVAKEFEKRQKRIFRDLESGGQRSIEEKAFEVYLDGQADGLWLREYRCCQLWLGTREPHDHRKLYFTDRDEVDGLSIEVMRKLLETYQELEVPPDEGKG